MEDFEELFRRLPSAEAQERLAQYLFPLTRAMVAEAVKRRRKSFKVIKGGRAEDPKPETLKSKFTL